MFCVSKWLPEIEAIALARSMGASDRWYIYRVGSNPTAKHLQDRESFIVIRPYRKNEAIKAGESIFVEQAKMRPINGQN